MEKKLIKNLIEAKILKKEQLDFACSIQKYTGDLLIEVLIELYLDREEVSKWWAKTIGYEYIDLANSNVDEEIIKKMKIAEDLALRIHFIPISEKNGTITIAMYNPANIDDVDTLRLTMGNNIEIRVANLDRINEAIKKKFDSEKQKRINQEKIDKLIDRTLNGTSDANEQQSPATELVNLLIEKAILVQATDIHLSPNENVSILNLRVDGILVPTFALPKEIHEQLVSRIKVMSELKTDQKRIPQDGKIKFSYSGRDFDIRTSTAPTIFGENVVMRLLDKARVIEGLEGLGLNKDNQKKIRELSKRPNGMILSAGPTGSGKSTTLYSVLKLLNALEKNILTIEDPVEYQIPNIKQSQVNEKAGLVFSKAVRHFLRQDPNVLLIGEIRDKETARTAFQASMTGHLVLSTIHTNSAVKCIGRLTELGIDSSLITDSLLAVIAQRLARKVCNKCKRNYPFTDAEIKEYELENTGITSENKGKDPECKNCNGTGYKGQIGIFEILFISNKIGEMIYQGTQSSVILDYAVQEEGMTTMWADGLEKVKNGTTNMIELKRAIG